LLIKIISKHLSVKQNLNEPMKIIGTKPDRKLQTPWHILRIVAITIFLGEVLVMFFLSFLPGLSVIASILIDAILLSAISFPILYLFLYRPMVLNVNKLRAAEQEEDRQRKLFEQTFIQSSTSTQILDRDGWCLRINPKLSELFGVEPEQMEGHVYNIFKDEEIKRQGIDIILKSVFDELKTEQWEVNFDIGLAAESQGIKVKEKKKLWLSNRAYPIVDSKGKLLNVVIQHEEITDRKMAESVMKESEERFRELFNNAPVGYHELDTEGKIVRVNKTELEMLGYSEEEMVGRYIWDFDVDREISRQAVLARLADSKRIEKNFERVIRRKDGSTFPVLIEQLMLYDQNGTCTGLRSALQDITERKKYDIEIRQINKKLAEMNASKDKFFSIIAHDVKSPFSGIIGFSTILEEDAGKLKISTIKEYAGMIHSSANQVLELLDNLLEWARVQRGQIPFNPISIVLKELTAEVFNFLNENAKLKEISLINRIPDNLIIQADKNMVKTLIRNLASNAIKFTSEGGKVELSAIANPPGFDRQILVSVADNGVGIKQENIEKLFDIGSTYVARGTKNEKGTGLGLILCKEFVEKHGGKLWVESDADIESPNRGSTFKFTLPCQ
jgi:PAS domain S-box-containing protein